MQEMWSEAAGIYKEMLKWPLLLPEGRGEQLCVPWAATGGVGVQGAGADVQHGQAPEAWDRWAERAYGQTEFLKPLYKMVAFEQALYLYCMLEQ